MRNRTPIAIVLVIAAAMVVYGQTQPSTVAPADNPTVNQTQLTEVEQLRIQNIKKDFELTALRQQNLQLTYKDFIDSLRVKYKKPADKFMFDIQTMRFVPVVVTTNKKKEEK